MMAGSSTSRSPFNGIIMAALLLYSGYFLHQSLHIYVWGLGVMGLGLLVLSVSLLRFVARAFQSADQINLLRKSRKLSYTFGHARLAREDDPFIRQMAKSRRGLFLGALGRSMLFYDPFARGNGHMLTYAPSRTGKTISGVIPALLHWFGGSIVVTDVKGGELQKITARHRTSKGHRIILLDPFGTNGKTGARFNPLRSLVDDVLRHKGKKLGKLARLIAFQLIPEPAHDKGDGKFFRGGGRRLLCAMMLYLAAFDPTNCHLPGLRRLIWSTSDEKAAIASQLQSVDWFGCLLQDYGNILADMVEPQYIKTFGGYRDNAIDALEIFDANTDFGKACMESDFTLESVLDGKTTLYVILPEDCLETHGSWMGLIMMLLIETIAARPRSFPTLMLMEEMGNLGPVPNLGKALSLLPGKGLLRLWMIFQSRQQPIELYGPAKARLIEEQSSMIQQWAVRDLDDQKLWSARTGTTTQKTYSLNHDPRDFHSPWRLGVGERATPVLLPDQIRTMPEEAQLIAIDSQPVIMASKVPYFQIEPWRNVADPDPSHPGGYPKDKPVRYQVGI